MSLATRAITLSLFCMTLGACAYHSRDAVGLYPRQIHSVQVDVASNRTFWRGAENDLTEAVIKEIIHRTPYFVVGKSTADSQLKVTIRNITQTEVSRTTYGTPQEMEFTMTVDMLWNDLVTGREIKSLSGVSASGRYIPPQGGSELYEVAQRMATERMARDIVDDMRSDF